MRLDVVTVVDADEAFVEAHHIERVADAVINGEGRARRARAMSWTRRRRAAPGGSCARKRACAASGTRASRACS